jgi:hypothetical protein
LFLILLGDKISVQKYKKNIQFSNHLKTKSQKPKAKSQKPKAKSQ